MTGVGGREVTGRMEMTGVGVRVVTGRMEMTGGDKMYDRPQKKDGGIIVLLVIPLFLASHWDARNRGMTRSMMMTGDSRWHHHCKPSQPPPIIIKKTSGPPHLACAVTHVSRRSSVTMLPHWVLAR